MESSRRAEEERTSPLEEPAEPPAGSGPDEAAEWLPAGFKPPSLPGGDGAPAGPAAERPAMEPPPRAAARSGEPSAPAAGATASELAARQEQLERRVEDVLRLQEQNGRQQSALTSATESLRARVEALEAQIAELPRRGAGGDPLAEATSYVDAHEPAPLPADGEPVDLNAADFDQLRALGLSITQAARLIARRDAVNGFSSEDEVAALPGFPKGLLEDLLSRTRL